MKPEWLETQKRLEEAVQRGLVHPRVAEQFSISPQATASENALRHHSATAYLSQVEHDPAMAQRVTTRIQENLQSLEMVRQHVLEPFAREYNIKHQTLPLEFDPEPTIIGEQPVVMGRQRNERGDILWQNQFSVWRGGVGTSGKERIGLMVNNQLINRRVAILGQAIEKPQAVGTSEDMRRRLANLFEQARGKSPASVLRTGIVAEKDYDENMQSALRYSPDQQQTIAGFANAMSIVDFPPGSPERQGLGDKLRKNPEIFGTLTRNNYTSRKSSYHVIATGPSRSGSPGIAHQYDAEGNLIGIIGDTPKGLKNIRPEIRASDWPIDVTTGALLTEVGGRARRRLGPEEYGMEDDASPTMRLIIPMWGLPIPEGAQFRESRINVQQPATLRREIPLNKEGQPELSPEDSETLERLARVTAEGQWLYGEEAQATIGGSTLDLAGNFERVRVTGFTTGVETLEHGQRRGVLNIRVMRQLAPVAIENPLKGMSAASDIVEHFRLPDDDPRSGMPIVVAGMGSLTRIPNAMADVINRMPQEEWDPLVRQELARRQYGLTYEQLSEGVRSSAESVSFYQQVFRQHLARRLKTQRLEYVLDKTTASLFAPRTKYDLKMQAHAIGGSVREGKVYTAEGQELPPYFESMTDIGRGQVRVVSNVQYLELDMPLRAVAKTVGERSSINLELQGAALEKIMPAFEKSVKLWGLDEQRAGRERAKLIDLLTNSARQRRAARVIKAIQHDYEDEEKSRFISEQTLDPVKIQGLLSGFQALRGKYDDAELVRYSLDFYQYVAGNRPTRIKDQGKDIIVPAASDILSFLYQDKDTRLNPFARAATELIYQSLLGYKLMQEEGDEPSLQPQRSAIESYQKAASEFLETGGLKKAAEVLRSRATPNLATVGLNYGGPNQMYLNTERLVQMAKGVLGDEYEDEIRAHIERQSKAGRPVWSQVYARNPVTGPGSVQLMHVYASEAARAFLGEGGHNYVDIGYGEVGVTQDPQAAAAGDFDKDTASLLPPLIGRGRRGIYPLIDYRAVPSVRDVLMESRRLGHPGGEIPGTIAKQLRMAGKSPEEIAITLLGETYDPATDQPKVMSPEQFSKKSEAFIRSGIEMSSTYNIARRARAEMMTGTNPAGEQALARHLQALYQSALDMDPIDYSVFNQKTGKGEYTLSPEENAALIALLAERSGGPMSDDERKALVEAVAASRQPGGEKQLEAYSQRVNPGVTALLEAPPGSKDIVPGKSPASAIQVESLPPTAYFEPFRQYQKRMKKPGHKNAFREPFKQERAVSTDPVYYVTPSDLGLPELVKRITGIGGLVSRTESFMSGRLISGLLFGDKGIGKDIMSEVLGTPVEIVKHRTLDYRYGSTKYNIQSLPLRGGANFITQRPGKRTAWDFRITQVGPEFEPGNMSQLMAQGEQIWARMNEAYGSQEADLAKMGAWQRLSGANQAAISYINQDRLLNNLRAQGVSEDMATAIASGQADIQQLLKDSALVNQLRAALKQSLVGVKVLNPTATRAAFEAGMENARLVTAATREHAGEEMPFNKWGYEALGPGYAGPGSAVELFNRISSASGGAGAELMRQLGLLPGASLQSEETIRRIFGRWKGDPEQAIERLNKAGFPVSHEEAHAAAAAAHGIDTGFISGDTFLADPETIPDSSTPEYSAALHDTSVAGAAEAIANGEGIQPSVYEQDFKQWQEVPGNKGKPFEEFVADASEEAFSSGKVPFAGIFTGPSPDIEPIPGEPSSIFSAVPPTIPPEMGGWPAELPEEPEGWWEGPNMPPSPPSPPPPSGGPPPPMRIDAGDLLQRPGTMGYVSAYQPVPVQITHDMVPTAAMARQVGRSVGYMAAYGGPRQAVEMLSSLAAKGRSMSPEEAKQAERLLKIIGGVSARHTAARRVQRLVEHYMRTRGYLEETVKAEGISDKDWSALSKGALDTVIGLSGEELTYSDIIRSAAIYTMQQEPELAIQVGVNPDLDPGGAKTVHATYDILAQTGSFFGEAGTLKPFFEIDNEALQRDIGFVEERKRLSPKRTASIERVAGRIALGDAERYGTQTVSGGLMDLNRHLQQLASTLAKATGATSSLSKEQISSIEGLSKAWAGQKKVITELIDAYKVGEASAGERLGEIERALGGTASVHEIVAGRGAIADILGRVGRAVTEAPPGGVAPLQSALAQRSTPRIMTPLEDYLEMRGGELNILDRLGIASARGIYGRNLREEAYTRGEMGTGAERFLLQAFGGAHMGLESLNRAHYVYYNVLRNYVEPTFSGAGLFAQAMFAGQQTLAQVSGMPVGQAVDSTAFRYARGPITAREAAEYQFGQIAYSMWSPWMQTGLSSILSGARASVVPALGAYVATSELTRAVAQGATGIGQLVSSFDQVRGARWDRMGVQLGGLASFLGLGAAGMVLGMAAAGNVASYNEDIARQMQFSAIEREPLGGVGRGLEWAKVSDIFGTLSLWGDKLFGGGQLYEKQTARYERARGFLAGEETGELSLDDLTGIGALLRIRLQHRFGSNYRDQIGQAYGLVQGIMRGTRGQEYERLTGDITALTLAGISAQDIAGLTQALAQLSSGFVLDRSDVSMQQALGQAINFAQQPRQAGIVMAVSQALAPLQQQAMLLGQGQTFNAQALVRGIEADPGRFVDVLRLAQYGETRLGLSTRYQAYATRPFDFGYAQEYFDTEAAILDPELRAKWYETVRPPDMSGMNAFDRRYFAYQRAVREGAAPRAEMEAFARRQGTFASMQDLLLRLGAGQGQAEEMALGVATTDLYGDEGVVNQVATRLLMSGIMPTGLTMSRANRFAQMGIDVLGAAEAMGAGRGVLPVSQNYEQLIAEAADRLSRRTGEGIAEYLERVQLETRGIRFEAQYNQLARMFGQPMAIAGQFNRLTDEQQSMLMNVFQSQAGVADILPNAFGRLGALVARQRIEAGDLVGGRQLTQNLSAINQLFNQYAQYGGATEANYNILQQIALLPPEQARRYLAVLSGNPIAASLMYDRRAGFGGSFMYTLQTGAAGGTPGMFAGYDEDLTDPRRRFLVNEIRQTDIKFGGIAQAASAAGGIDLTGMNYVQLTALQNRLQFQQMQFGFEQERMSIARRREMMMGSGFSGMGVAVEGAGLDMRGVVRDLTQEAGLDKMVATWTEGGEKLLEIVKGWSEWSLEDAETRLRREQQDFNLQMEQRQLQLSQTRFELGGQQFYERLGLRERQMAIQFGWQERDLTISQQRNQRQFQWQLEDIYFSRNQTQLGFGWQMEDFDRNLRYARGIQRMDLMRQRERAVVEFSMQMSQSQRQESRAREQHGWTEQDFQRERQRHEQRKQWALEEMQMDRRHFEQNRALERQELEMRRVVHEKQREWLLEERQLENVSIALKRLNAKLELAEAEAMQKLSEQMALNFKAIAAQIEAIGTRNKEAEATFKYYVETGKILQYVNPRFEQFTKDLTSFGTAVVNLIKEIRSAAGARSGSSGGGGRVRPTPMWDGGYVPMPGYDDGGYVDDLRSYAKGGFTGYGHKYQPMGVVHGGEYVVPIGGSLVLREHSSRQDEVQLLREIVDWLKKIFTKKETNQQFFIETNMPKGAREALTTLDQSFGRLS